MANRIKLHVQANGTPQQKAKVEEFKEEEDRLQLLDAFLSVHKLVFFEWEQERIGKLTFLDSVPGFSDTTSTAASAAAPMVYHFHPINFIKYLHSGVTLQTVMPAKPENIRKIVLHSTATQEGVHETVETIFAKQKPRGFKKIAYHYVIYLNGSLHFGRPENEEGAHATNTVIDKKKRRIFNTDSIGVVYVGGVSDKAGTIPKDTRTQAQKETQAQIIEALMERYPKATVHGHGELARMHNGGSYCPSFDVQADFGHYNDGKTPDTRAAETGALKAF